MNCRLGVDIDGVLSDIAGHLVRFLNDRFGREVAIEDLISENVETCLDVSVAELQEIFTSPVFFQTLPLICGADIALKKLRDTGWSIILITDRFWYPAIQADTLEWLTKNSIAFETVYFARKTEKVVLAKDLEIDLFIEDQLSNANSLAKQCRQVFLIDRPYNVGPTGESITRVENIEDVVRILNTLMKKFATV